MVCTFIQAVFFFSFFFLRLKFYFILFLYTHGSHEMISRREMEMAHAATSDYFDCWLICEYAD